MTGSKSYCYAVHMIKKLIFFRLVLRGFVKMSMLPASLACTGSLFHTKTEAFMNAPRPGCLSLLESILCAKTISTENFRSLSDSLIWRRKLKYHGAIHFMQQQWWWCLMFHPIPQCTIWFEQHIASYHMADIFLVK